MLFSTLKAEIARRGLKPVDVVAEALGVSPKTAYNKITGASKFTLNETVSIRDKYFPGMTLEELFLPEQKGA
jgi:hypothetical protein